MAGDKAILFGWLDQDEANVWQSDGTADGTSILGQVPYEGDNISFSCNNDIAIFYPKYTLGDVLIVEGENLNTLSTYVNNYSIANGSFISGYILDNWLLMTSNENEGILLDLDSGDTIVFITSCKVSHAALIGDKFCYSGHGPEGVIDLFLKESIQQQEPNEQIFNSGSFYNTGLAYKGRYFSVSQDIWANIVTFNNEFNLSIRVHGIGDHIALQNPQIIGFGDNVYFNEIDDYDTQFRLVKASMCPEIKSTVIDTLADIFSRYVAKPILCTIDDKMLVSKYEEDTGFELYRYYPAPDLDGDCYDETFDCDDSDPNLNPSAIDIPGNGIDEDCSGDDDVNDFTAFVSPNPISDLTTIQLFDTEVANLMIYSLDGRLINHYKLTSESTELSLNHLTSGFYIFKFIGPFDKTVTRKVIRM